MSSQPSSDVTWSSLWAALGYWDKILLAVTVLCFGAGYLLPGGTTASGLQLLGYGTGFWLTLRVVRKFLRHILWRLRNRLLVAYAFIAVVPVVLIVVLTGIVLYAMVGQMAVFMVTSELERRTSLIVSSAQYIAEEDTDRRALAIEQAYPVLANQLPGLEILIEGKNTHRYPPGAKIQPPHEEWGDSGGLAVREGSLFAWAHIVRENARVTIAVPITDSFTAALAPNIGEIGFWRMDEEATQPRRRLRFQQSSVKALPFDAPRNRVPEQDNRFDIEVTWATALPAYMWDTAGRVENELMRIRTRPFAVLRTVFAQKVDMWQEVAPILLISFSVAFLIAEIISLIIGVSLTRTITTAVHDLYEGTERIKESDFSHRIHIKGQDQLADLGLSFNNMTANIERLLVVAKENERLQNELEIAREVQTQLYPRVTPMLKSMSIEALLSPARMVSGDYYDYQKLDGSRLAVAIGDVAGKGISAALLMATVQSALRTQIRHCLEGSGDGELQVSTSQLVSQLNKHLHAHTSPEKFATFYLGVYDEANSVLTYTNAGHLPPILIHDGETGFLEVNGTVVGAFPFSRYGESQVKLELGDKLLFYTDGITEAENAYGEQFGEQRLCDLLRKQHGNEPAKILSSIHDAVLEWTGSPELQDDMTLLLAARI